MLHCVSSLQSSFADIITGMIDTVIPYLVFTCEDGDIQKDEEVAQGQITSGYRAGMWSCLFH